MFGAEGFSIIVSGKDYLLYLGAVNAVSFALMAADKKRARRRRRRVRERMLILLAAAGGALGVWAGMPVFRHKTRHVRFRILAPLLSILWLVLSLWLLDRGFIN